MLLAAAWGATAYSCDDRFERHAAEAPGGVAARLVSWSAGERLARPVGVQVADRFAAYREQFPLVVRDVAAIGGAVVVEGAALLPELVAGLGVPAARAAWLVPTPRFQVRHYARRAWARELLRDAPDPGGAFRRWMRRDARFAAAVAGQARDPGHRVVVVDGSRSAARIAADLFGVDRRGAGRVRGV
ncbi:hypothetical protein [Saccharothrix sp. HUAS TT1]|uniref:hypothetical protein n=1 Tax=unclassified Saccharothrix TaxID=2593673 RepID=UPI00345B8C11